MHGVGMGGLAGLGGLGGMEGLAGEPSPFADQCTVPSQQQRRPFLVLWCHHAMCAHTFALLRPWS